MNDHRNRLVRALEKLWYRPRLPWYGIPLLPLSWLFRALARRRRAAQTGNAVRLPVPVIVVGNISVGGTGKTPAIQAIAASLVQHGYRPGIVSRGYGAHITSFPVRVPFQADAHSYGDEPALLARSTACPVVIDPDRVRAAQHLLATTQCNVILSDDGLQHYRLSRDIEIIVMDGKRGVGNGHCLPAGPLREPVSRLQTGVLLLCNGQGIPGLEASVMTLEPRQWHHLASGAVRRVEDGLPFSRAHAVAGIGNPQRFFSSLENLGLAIEAHAFGDHHAFTAGDMAFDDDWPVVMTSKDAIKCQHWADEHLWSLEVNARLPDDFIHALITRLKEHS